MKSRCGRFWIWIRVSKMYVRIRSTFPPRVLDGKMFTADNLTVMYRILSEIRSSFFTSVSLFHKH